MISRHKFSLFLLAAAMTIATPHGRADTITRTTSGPFPTTVTATLTNQSSVLLDTITLSTASNLTVTSTSYATGGFEPNLFLYNSAGNFLAAGSPFGALASTGIVGDMRLTATNLAAGSYTLAVTDFLLNQSLTATNLSAGFTQNYGDGVTFVDDFSNVRTANFAATIAATSVTGVPEPATMWLAAPILAGFAFRARRQKTKRNQQESLSV